MLLASRLIRFQFRKGGVVHLATCHTDNDRSYNVTSGPTLCGKMVHPGQGGWGHSSSTRATGPKCCRECFQQGAPAEKMRY